MFYKKTFHFGGVLAKGRWYAKFVNSVNKKKTHDKLI